MVPEKEANSQKRESKRVCDSLKGVELVKAVIKAGASSSLSLKDENVHEEKTRHKAWFSQFKRAF